MPAKKTAKNTRAKSKKTQANKQKNLKQVQFSKPSIILGISCYFHDSAAAIIIDGKVVAAAAEERFTRKKHDNTFPINAINFCLDFAGIAANEITAVSFYEKPMVKFERVLHQFIQSFPDNRQTFFESFPQWFTHKLQVRETLTEKLEYHGPVTFVEHHLSHAASGFYTSPYTEAAVVCIDGVGEWTTTCYGTAKGTNINITHEQQFPHSLGLFYSAMTAYLGFKVNNDEYKVMGLAAYGDPKPYRAKLKKLLTVEKDGSFTLNQKYFTFNNQDRMYTDALEELLGPTRMPETGIDARHENIAASAQELLEETIFTIFNHVQKVTKQKYLIFAGGVALNSVLNGKILSRTNFTQWFSPPEPGDAGGAIGAALYTHFNNMPYSADLPAKWEVPSTYLGPEYSWYDVLKAFETGGFNERMKLTFIPEKKKLLSKVADLIIKDAVIGWFQGRMEWGPRALGNRSILAHTTNEEIRDIINAKVKKREPFRPFAPVILAEKTADYFESDKELSLSCDYMLSVYPFHEKVKKKVPAVVHVDGTGRLQTVRHEGNPLYYELIEQYYKKTGIPLILNTSFNVRGEPIVCTPADAFRCFESTEIDYLVIDQFLVEKISPAKTSKKATKNKKTKKVKK